MIFSATATHALRAVACLAGNESGEAMGGRDLAKRVGLPGHYLAKVLATLARSGLLTASRGVKGGYRLARRADRIRLMEVVLPFEGQRARPGCLLRPDRPCRDSGACSAHPAWGAMKKAFTRFLEKTTVADIQGGEPGLLSNRSRGVSRSVAGAHRGRSTPRRGRA
jgi:Rrf2 family protein